MNSFNFVNMRFVVKVVFFSISQIIIFSFYLEYGNYVYTGL